MKKYICFLIFSFCIFGAVSAAPNELAAVKKQITQVEQQNKKIEQQVKTSDREVEKTKKQLVGAAENLDKIESQRGEIKDKIKSLDARRDILLSSIVTNQ